MILCDDDMPQDMLTPDEDGELVIYLFHSAYEERFS